MASLDPVPPSTLSPPPSTTRMVVAIRAKHGAHIAFSFNVPLNANGEQFMLQLQSFLDTTIFRSQHVSYRGWAARLLFKETISLATVSGVYNHVSFFVFNPRRKEGMLLTPPLQLATTPSFHDNGQAWPIDLLLSESSHSRDFTVGYHHPAILACTSRFAEHPAFWDSEQNDRRVLVIERGLSSVGAAVGVAVFVVLTLLTYGVVGAVTKRWDIAAGVGASLFATLNLAQAVALWHLR